MPPLSQVSVPVKVTVDIGLSWQYMAVQYAIGGLCVYEIAAILSRHRLPTVSVLCRKHRWAEALFLSWLVVHLHRAQKEIKETVSI